MERRKKSKATSTQILAGEDLMKCIAQSIDIESIIEKHRTAGTEQFSALTKCLRLPQRRLENGLSIQAGVKKQLSSGRLLRRPISAISNDSSEDEINCIKSKKKQIRTAHPGIQKIYDSIPTSLSAFDQSVCENQAWVNKYAPTCAAEMLQLGSEAFILKEWLQALNVDAVDTGNRDTRENTPNTSRRGASKSDGTSKSKKKKRKSNRLDDFIVDDDESEMEELSVSEDDLYPSGSQGSQKKTVLRSRPLGSKGLKTSTRLSNALVISGPHGSGKTAAVYAVAKELGFEVFEINSSSRRSGKDIMEKVGDMTRNHLVQRTANSLLPAVSEGGPIDESRKAPDAVEQELKSGRQKSMQSFFQPVRKTKGVTIEKSVPKKDDESPAPQAAQPPKAKVVSQGMINAFFQPKKSKAKADEPAATVAELASTSLESDGSQISPTQSADKIKAADPTGLGTNKAETSEEQQANEVDCDTKTTPPAHAASPSTAAPSSQDVPAPKIKAEKQVRKQKQSLILFEEVDILYEEDKQFWQTVLLMIAQSKRPIILTCIDESLVPLHTLPLHAIIRCQPPPADLATDYMLLAAANEGHVLDRDAVKTLYHARKSDLRASLTELNFWCQMAVGDQKGGLEWYQPRWPPGCDKDKDGHTIRVVSKNTFQTGMGWLSQDFLGEERNSLDLEEETLHEAWDSWTLDIADWHATLDLESWSLRIQEHFQGDVQKINALNMYEAFVDTMSAADVCGGGEFGTGCQTNLDAGTPTISNKTRDDYIIGYGLIQADERQSYRPLSKDVSIWMRSHARESLHVKSKQIETYSFPELSQPSESDLIKTIVDANSTDSSNVTRKDFSAAFDPISEPVNSNTSNTASLELSTFDRTLSLIAVDVAPYVRAIVTSDVKLQEERLKLNSLLNAGDGRGSKRMRTTRAAMSALEGGARESTRRERYFGDALNAQLVLKTGVKSWQDALSAVCADVVATVVASDTASPASATTPDPPTASVSVAAKTLNGDLNGDHCTPMHGVQEAMAC